MVVLNSQQLEDFDAAIQANVDEFNRIGTLNSRLTAQLASITARINAQIAANNVLQDGLATEVSDAIVNYTNFTEKTVPATWQTVADSAP